MPENELDNLEEAGFSPSITTSTPAESDLNFPIDSQSKKVIKSVLAYPVATRIQDTSAATAANYGIFFIAHQSCNVLAAYEVHQTKGTDGSAVTLQIEKLTGTTAAGSGTNLLSTAFDLKGNINTVQTATLVTTGATILVKGDRLALKTSGVLTAVASVNVTVYIQPI